MKFRTKAGGVAAIMLALVATIAIGQTFTDVNSAKYAGKTKYRKRAAVLDANFAFMEQQTTSVAHSGTLTVTGGSVLLSGIGSGPLVTNTVSLANVAAGLVGGSITIVVAPGSTNLITIADSANVRLAGAWVANTNDTLTLHVTDTNQFSETSRSNN